MKKSNFKRQIQMSNLAKFDPKDLGFSNFEIYLNKQMYEIHEALIGFPLDKNLNHKCTHKEIIEYTKKLKSIEKKYNEEKIKENEDE